VFAAAWLIAPLAAVYLYLPAMTAYALRREGTEKLAVAAINFSLENRRMCLIEASPVLIK
jgi:hypothetical protein